MSFTLHAVKNGKDIVLFENNKYRESYSVKNGDIVWRCLGRTCKASVKTNMEKTVIYSSKKSHTGLHPVTMQTLQTPTPPRRKNGSSSATPVTTSSPFYAVANVNSSDVSPTTETLLPLIQSASCADGPQESFTVAEKQDNNYSLRTENTALKEELVKLRMERQVVLDHSIESDQRLLQYTDEIFMPPPSIPSVSLGHLETKHVLERELERAQTKIRELEEEISILKRPCEVCIILKEETKNMLQSLRCLEAERQQLELSSVCQASHLSYNPPSVPVPTRNNFQILEEDLNDPEEEFVTIEKNKKRRKRVNSNINKKINLNNKAKKKNPTPEVYLSIPFSSVTVVGDSHARDIASLIKKRLRVGSTISGVCKPGAGLLDVRPTSTPPRNHCFVLMAGTNDVDAGREDVIFTHLEEVVATLKKVSSVLVLPLMTRHDLDPKSPIHDTINLVNNYMEELCHRHQNVELLDIGSIRRHHHTMHGLHLQASGKRVLASLIAERLATMRPFPTIIRPRQGINPVAIQSKQSTPVSPAPYTLPHETYAEAITQSMSKSVFKSNLQTVTSTTNPVFLGKSTLATYKTRQT